VVRHPCPRSREAAIGLVAPGTAALALRHHARTRGRLAGLGTIACRQVRRGEHDRGARVSRPRAARALDLERIGPLGPQPDGVVERHRAPLVADSDTRDG